MEIIWGYTASEEMLERREIGNEVKEVKQLFSALLFKSGIKGISAVILGITGSPQITMSLEIDSKQVFVKNFSPIEAEEFYFNSNRIFYPETKIEIFMKVENGTVFIPISSIGNGMGYQKSKEEFQPTKHFALGLIIS